MDKNLTNWVLSCVGMMHCYGLPANPYPLLGKRGSKNVPYLGQEKPKLDPFWKHFFALTFPSQKTL